MIKLKPNLKHVEALLTFRYKNICKQIIIRAIAIEHKYKMLIFLCYRSGTFIKWSMSYVCQTKYIFLTKLSVQVTIKQ